MVIIRVLWGAAVRKYIFNQESNILIRNWNIKSRNQKLYNTINNKMNVVI